MGIHSIYSQSLMSTASSPLSGWQKSQLMKPSVSTTPMMPSTTYNPYKKTTSNKGLSKKDKQLFQQQKDLIKLQQGFQSSESAKSREFAGSESGKDRALKKGLSAAEIAANERMLAAQLKHGKAMQRGQAIANYHLSMMPFLQQRNMFSGVL